MLSQFKDRDRRGPFSLLQVHIATPFQAPGFLAHIAAALAARTISILIISTFSFDYILVAKTDETAATKALASAGFRVILAT
jgi:hypothetical protein